MTPMPMLSVIIPTYNRARFVTACVTSVLSCGVESPEPVVVDDGSTDDTEAVVRAFGPAVKYVRQANAGPAAARNLGFAASSSGRYVAFLDCDDQWIAGAPLRALEALDRHPAAAAIFADAQRTRAGELLATYLETYGRDDFRALTATNLGAGLHRLARGPAAAPAGPPQRHLSRESRSFAAGSSRRLAGSIPGCVGQQTGS